MTGVFYSSVRLQQNVTPSFQGKFCGGTKSILFRVTFFFFVRKSNISLISIIIFKLFKFCSQGKVERDPYFPYHACAHTITGSSFRKKPIGPLTFCFRLKTCLQTFWFERKTVPKTNIFVPKQVFHSEILVSKKKFPSDILVLSNTFLQKFCF